MLEYNDQGDDEYCTTLDHVELVTDPLATPVNYICSSLMQDFSRTRFAV